MKKLAIIFTCVFVIAAVCFGISFAVIDGGVMSDNGQIWGGGTLTEDRVEHFTSEDSYNDIEVSVIAADTTIMQGTGNTTTVDYRTNRNGVSYTCEIKGGKLIVKENFSFSFNFFGWFKNRTELKITVPAETYNSLAFNSVSGDSTMNGIEAESMDISTTSGNFEFNVYANNLSIGSTSGDMTVSNCTSKSSNSLKLNTTSGKYSISGFKTQSFVVNSISGDISLSGISGKGKASLTSGNLELSFAEWNDSLEINLVSGDADVYLPNGSGASVNYSAMSGEVESELDGDDFELKKDRTTEIGGSNVQDVRINLTSGHVTFMND